MKVNKQNRKERNNNNKQEEGYINLAKQMETIETD